MKLLLDLFLSFFQIGLLSFGGGYAAMPLIKEQVVELHGWLSMSGFADIITIAEMTPGPVSINCATFVGIQVAGIPGAVIATLGCITPSCFIVTALAWVYYKYKGLDTVKAVLASIRPAIIAMIASAGLSLFQLSVKPEGSFVCETLPVNIVAFIVFVLAFLVTKKFKVSPISVIAGSGVLTLLIYFVFA
ncbi:MAG: chromate transporter [Lachnospiraceae bacterium]|nr:chromate transporter [Lachnospiraceae bacterium]